MRRQALQVRNEEAPGCENIEAVFIERLGLAAWIECGPESFIPTEAPTTEPQKAKSTHNQLVIVLADFVVRAPKGMGYG
jgi:hypothetical protein